jgi:hypothetical protein
MSGKLSWGINYLEKRRDFGMYVSIMTLQRLAYFMVTRGERLTVGNQLCQSTVAGKCDVMSSLLSGETEMSVKWTVCQN